LRRDFFLKESFSMEGLNLIACYCFPPNLKKYCGPESPERIFKFMTGEFTNEPNVKNAFLRFEVMYPYLQLIAKANNKSAFDFEVAQAYWEGNELLENVSLNDWKETAAEIGKSSKWPEKIIEKYAERISESFLPHHSFHVLNSFTLTIKEPEVMLERINNCLISWGRVLNAGEKELIVEKKPVVLEPGGTFNFGQATVESVQNTAFGSSKRIVECVKGDWVSMHWGFACRKLEIEELENLEKFTCLNFENFKL